MPYVKEIDFTYVPSWFNIFHFRKSTSGSKELYNHTGLTVAAYCTN